MERQEEGIHYRQGGKLTHCGIECLPGGRDIQYIVIERIEYKDSEEVAGRRESNVWVAHFASNQYTKLPMILNATNRKRIAKLYPECNGYINLLRNIPVRLTKEKCRDVQDGGETWGLRISKTRPTVPSRTVPAEARPTITLEDSNVIEQAVKYIVNGGSMEEIKRKYDFSAEVEKFIMQNAEKK